MGPVAAFSLKKGAAVDILPHFGGSIEKAHAAVKHSKDTLRALRPGVLHTHVCDDNGKPVDVEALLGGKVVSKKEVPAKPKPSEDVTRPDVDTSAVMAAQDQFEAQKTGEANPPPSEDVGGEVVGTNEDEFTQMEGVGEATAQKLREAGYTTFASLAEASLDNLVEILGNSRIAKNVQKQAKKIIE